MADSNDSIGGSDEGNLVTWARQKVSTSKTDLVDWRQEAIDQYGLVACDQWDEEAKNTLEADGRPVFTFNRVAGFVRGICGLETSTRSTATLFARENSDTASADVLNAAVRYVRDCCDADDEDSDAFKDMLICGVGWTETLFSTKNDPDGEIIVERVDPLHMTWDTSARKRGLADTRWRARTKWLSYSEIKDVWGKAKADEIGANSTTDTESLDELYSKIQDATPPNDYDGGTQGGPVNKSAGDIPVVQFQYIKTQWFYRIQNPLTGAPEEVDQETLDKLNDKLVEMGMGELDSIKFKRHEYRQLIYSGVTMLEEECLPCHGFTFNPITGIRDRNRGIWYGFVRDLMDPQRWINKFFSSMADVVASQAKGGLLAEVDAFVSKDRAVEDWSNPRSIVWLKQNGLAKVKERTSAGVPAGIQQLLDFTVASLPNVAGVNLEFLGMASREQPGVLEHQRKQAAIATLAEFFNALRLYRKQQTRVLLQFINEFISDGRMVRIVGKAQAEYVQLTRQPGVLKYDVVVDEAPTSPDQKERTWATLMQLLPVAASMGLPIPPNVIEYSPLPQALIDQWMKFAGGEGGMPPQAKAQMQQMQEQLAALQKENQSLKSKEQVDMAKLQQSAMEAQQKLALQKEQGQADIQLEIQKLQAQIQLKQMELRANMEIEQAKMQGQMVLDQQKQDFDMDLQANQQLFEQITKPEEGQGEGEGKQVAPRSSKLLEIMGKGQDQSSQAIMEMAKAVAQLAEQQTKPRTITDGKGRTFTVTQGD